MAQNLCSFSIIVFPFQNRSAPECPVREFWDKCVPLCRCALGRRRPFNNFSGASVRSHGDSLSPAARWRPRHSELRHTLPAKSALRRHRGLNFKGGEESLWLPRCLFHIRAFPFPALALIRVFRLAGKLLAWGKNSQFRSTQMESLGPARSGKSSHVGRDRSVSSVAQSLATGYGSMQEESVAALHTQGKPQRIDRNGIPSGPYARFLLEPSCSTHLTYSGPGARKRKS